MFHRLGIFDRANDRPLQYSPYVSCRKRYFNSLKHSSHELHFRCLQSLLTFIHKKEKNEKKKQNKRRTYVLYVRGVIDKFAEFSSH